MRHPRTGEIGKRSWKIQGSNQSPLTGFSHGAAGFAYALSSLATLSHREDFEAAAQECIAYEDSHYDDAASNWADFRTSDETRLPSQWCHGAVGIGLARVASNRATMMCTDKSILDINRSVKNTVTNWPQRVDTLCCGTLGAIEFLSEACDSLNQPDLGQLADQRLASATRSSEGWILNCQTF